MAGLWPTCSAPVVSGGLREEIDHLNERVSPVEFETRGGPQFERGEVVGALAVLRALASWNPCRACANRDHW